MLSPRRLHELLDIDAAQPEVLSLYLELDRSGTPQAYKWILQEAVDREPSLRELRKDLDRIERFLAGFKPGVHRGVAVFASEALGLWEACPLPYVFKSCMTLDHRAYLAPLTAVMDQHQRYGVAALGPGSARFLEVHLGEIEERIEDAPLPRPLSRRAPPQPDPPHDRLRTLASRASWLARNRGWDRLILGAPKELEPLFVAHLSIRLKHNLIVDPAIREGLPAEQVLEKVMANEREARKVRESVLAHRLVDAAATDGPAVLGLERTLDALQRGLVRTLLVRDGLAKIGRICSGCSRLSLADKKCRACNQPTVQVFNLIAEIVQCGLDQDCEVVPVLYDVRLDSLGRIGAELSHKPSQGSPPGPAQAGKPKPLTIPL
ncbi:MAG: hypothetical protein HY554_10215 [Elusimicrobia bacterium]|nr:hypothetical protein [Elusimicrobiota bacterium]